MRMQGESGFDRYKTTKPGMKTAIPAASDVTGARLFQVLMPILSHLPLR